MVIGSGMVGVGKVKYPYSYRDAFAAFVTIGVASVTIGAVEPKTKFERGKPGPKQRDGSCAKMTEVSKLGVVEEQCAMQG